MRKAAVFPEPIGGLGGEMGAGRKMGVTGDTCLGAG